jgi:predicted nucleotide-binding protein
MDTSWLMDFDSDNLLAVYDVLLDIRQETQMSGARINVPVFRSMIRFSQLFPMDSIPMRDKYCEIRWKAMKFLESKGVVSSLEPLDASHRWETRIEMDVNNARASEVLVAVKTEYEKRIPPPAAQSLNPNPMPKPTEQNIKAKVFVVHGRNRRLRNGVFTFLRSIGLRPIEWTDAVALTGKSAPYVGEILDVAFSAAQAVVVVLSPDDEARLREELRGKEEPDYETKLTPQARPNVLFEAGMAMARNPDRTVLVEFGRLRPFSDVAGRHAIKMDGSTSKRQDLAMRLQKAGCAVELSGTDWHSVGDLDL